MSQHREKETETESTRGAQTVVHRSEFTETGDHDELSRFARSLYDPRPKSRLRPTRKHDEQDSWGCRGESARALVESTSRTVPSRLGVDFESAPPSCWGKDPVGARLTRTNGTSLRQSYGEGRGQVRRRRKQRRDEKARKTRIHSSGRGNRSGHAAAPESAHPRIKFVTPARGVLHLPPSLPPTPVADIRGN